MFLRPIQAAARLLAERLFFSFLLFGTSGTFEKLRRTFSKHIQVHFRPNQTLRQRLFHLMDQIPKQKSKCHSTGKTGLQNIFKTEKEAKCGKADFILRLFTHFFQPCQEVWITLNIA
ncbi:hypothetical protein AMECASPLE_027521 [Ameca splendens]|uniref:Secreted protein n=1 Tax=Ameca splendens TaxID=208324 RepID=A0ABV1A381_9TELE